MVTRVALSVLGCRLEDLIVVLKEAECAGANALHVDVMDGNFVPNLTWGTKFVEFLRGHTYLPLDVHLMVNTPSKFIDDFASAGADQITVHIESNGFEEALLKIKYKKKQVGLALKPKTEILNIVPYLGFLNTLLIMTVEPGQGGQSFMHEMKPKICKAKEIIDAHKKQINIQVDGGINDITGKEAVTSGANLLVSGSWLCLGEMKQKISALKIQN